jgi:tetratricopeptide (TPR) repeat protein
MPACAQSSRTTCWLWLAAAWLAAFILSCHSFVITAQSAAADGQKPLLHRILGSARLVLSEQCYQVAEEYFHKGTARKTQLAFYDSIFQQWRLGISPQLHVHREGKAVDEIMPWLWMAARADPHNLEHYISASFWLANEMQRPDLALQVLDTAKHTNPFAYRIALEQGVILLRTGQRDAATFALDAALAFWSVSEHHDIETARSEKARALLYRALLHEAEQRRDLAITDLRGILEMFPARHELETRIQELNSGAQPSLLASQLWNDMVNKEVDSRTSHEECGYCGEH